MTTLNDEEKKMCAVTNQASHYLAEKFGFKYIREYSLGYISLNKDNLA